jgi:hypothetical protein
VPVTVGLVSFVFFTKLSTHFSPLNAPSQVRAEMCHLKLKSGLFKPESWTVCS